MDVYENDGFLLKTPAGAQLADGARVSDGFFRTLGVAPMLGRDFRAGEDLPAAPRTVLLSYSAWQKRFGGRQDVLGKTVTLDGSRTRSSGCCRAAFILRRRSLRSSGLRCMPTMTARSMRELSQLSGRRPVEGRGLRLYRLRRRRDDCAQLEKQYPDSNTDRAGYLLPLADVIVGDIRPILLVLLGGAALLLLIAMRECSRACCWCARRAAGGKLRCAARWALRAPG